MSDRLFPEDVLFFQRILSAEGLYLADLDGDWGPLTEAAALEFERRSQALRDQIGAFDTRSERNIGSLALRAQREARLFLGRVLSQGITARIISGTRTYAQQAALFKQGRFGNPGPIVTNARAGFSNHNFGIAWDIGIFTAGGGYIPNGPQYDLAAQHGLSGATSLEWGGNWTGLVDKPHYQLKLGISVSALREAFESGRAQAAFA